jgi:hypothetical protein
MLNPVEARVLGALIEKEIATPDYYPLTLNALTLACNQTSNRDPVVDFDETQVVRALDSLRDKKWAFLYGGAQARVPRYGHKFNEVLDVSRAETAVLCVLLLRGPQTVGEIRTRTGRLHEFESLAEAEAVLEALASRPDRPLVTKLPRQSGMKEQRYAQLLGELPEAAPEGSAAPAPEAATLAVRAENERMARLEGEVAALRQEVAELREQFAAFRKQFE